MKPSPHQINIFKWVRDGQGSAIVVAVAGSGKTTTIINSLKFIPPSQKVCLLAFNKSIATELQRRIPKHCHAMTMNSLGHRAIMRSLNSKIVINDNKVAYHMAQTLDNEIISEFGPAIIKLVGFAKQHGIVPFQLPELRSLVPDANEQWQKLIDHYDIDINAEHALLVIHAARAVLLASIADNNTIDFNDQLYLPVIHRLKLIRYPWLIVDESQDVSHIQRALLHMSLARGGRLLAVGDPCQAIYGFRGADSDSLDNIAKEFKAIQLPLSVSYRCPRAVVAYAKQIVNHIEPAETAPDGLVISWNQYTVNDFDKKDMIICRNTAPLIQMAYRFISRRIGVNVIGRDIGQGLISLIERQKAITIRHLCGRLDYWQDKQISKAIENNQDSKIESIKDKYRTIMAIIGMANIRTVDDLIGEIYRLFEGAAGCITLSTIHKAKGLESTRVFILDPELMPSPYARQQWQIDQERNLQYVAYTRAQKDLIFIKSEGFSNAIANKNAA